MAGVAGSLYPPEAFLRVGSVVTMLGLAAWLLYLDRRSPLHMTFAGFLVMRSVLVAAPWMAESDAVASVAAPTVPLVQILIPFLVPFFLFNFQRCHCILHEHGRSFERPVRIFYQVAPILLAGAYLYRPELYAADLRAALVGAQGAQVGPLWASHGLDLLAFALIGLLFQKEVVQANTPLHRYSYLSVALGFSLTVLVEGFAGPLLALYQTSPSNPITWTHGLSLACSLLAAILATRVASGFEGYIHKSSDPDVKRLSRPVLGSIAAALVSIVLLVPASMASPTAARNVYGVVLALWSFALPVLVTYAILRHHLFDIDLKFRLTIKRGAIAAVFVAVFFAASEGTQALFQDRWGPFIGIGASSLLVLFLSPLQRRAEKFAQAAVPMATSTGQWSEPEKCTFYREQVHIAWGDGGLNVKERALLMNLREKLGLSPGEAEDIERQALGEHWLKAENAMPVPVSIRPPDA